MARTEYADFILVDEAQRRVALFKEIDKQFGQGANEFFSRCLSDRLEKIYADRPTMRLDAISSVLSSALYKSSCRKRSCDWPLEWYQIELRVLDLFSHWAEAWAHFQIWQIHLNYPEQGADGSYYQAQITLPVSESSYQDDFILDIKDVERKYRTLHSSQAMSIQDAIALINLSTLVLEQEWYEILQHINLSKSGAHFLLTFSSPEVEHPFIVSSARVSYADTSEDWLYFSAFFQNNNWKTMTNSQHLSYLTELGLLSPSISLTNCEPGQFDKYLWRHLSNADKCCEVIRLTVSGTHSQKMFYLFLAQKRLMKHLFEFEISLAFVVVEQPLMIKYYESLSLGSYCQFGYCTLAGSSNPTYKGVWVVPKLHDALTSTDYKNYKQQTFSQIKKTRQNELNHA
tara:strand:+ start:1358 stop:2557 length:1200 start_codon:yes stop_codon:yes gene_type:complete